jgi:hypothetical protein
MKGQEKGRTRRIGNQTLNREPMMKIEDHQEFKWKENKHEDGD